ncbi:MAG: hypothetical protein ABJ370_00910 [Paracoccaceae bacterium]
MEQQVVSSYYPKNFRGNPKCPLADFFGATILADRVDPAEQATAPASLTELTDETAEILGAYMETADEGLPISRVNHGLLPLLWVLDEDGRIFIALEEVYDRASLQKRFPLARGMLVPQGYFKLGHPALVEGSLKKARIGGELLFDPDEDYGVKGWLISNASGRFGFGSHRSPAHLNNVADVFASFGIRVDVYYIPPAE